MYKYLLRLLPLFALCTPLFASMVPLKEQPHKPTQVLDYTFTHPPKKQVDHTLYPEDLSDEDLADDLNTISLKSQSQSILLNAILSNQPKKFKVVKKEEKEQKEKEEEPEGQEASLMVTHLPQLPGNAPLQEPIYTKYVLTASGLLHEKAHGITHLLSYHIVQTHPSHIVPTLLQWLQKSKEKHLIDLAISEPICGRCKYLLNVVIGYTQDVATSPQGCQGQLLKWQEIPPLALDYLNHYVSRSSKPLAIAQVLLSTFTDLSPNDFDKLKLEVTKLKQDLLTKDKELKEVDELMNRELNKAHRKHQQEKSQLSNSLQQQKLEITKLKKELATSQKLVQELLSPSVKEQEKEEKENYPATYTSGVLRHTFTGHKIWVTSLAYLGNGQCLSASHDNPIKLWDLNQKKCLHTFTGHTAAVWSLAYLGNGQCLSASSDNTIKLWDLNQKKCLHTFTGHTFWVYSLAYLGNGQCLSASGDTTIKLWDLNQKKCLHTFTGHTAAVWSLAYLGNGQCLSGSFDTTIKLWDLKAKQCLHTFTGHTHEVMSLAYLGNGQCLSASADKTIKLWDLNQKKCRHTFTGHTSAVISLAYLGNRQCLSGSNDTTIKLWDLNQKKCLHTFTGHTHEVSSLASLGNGQCLSASADYTLKLWQLK